jgi:hypothetical protein
MLPIKNYLAIVLQVNLCNRFAKKIFEGIPQKYDEALWNIARGNHPKAVEYLIKENANILSKYNEGLYNASRGNYPNVAKYLIKDDADTRSKNFLSN